MFNPFIHSAVSIKNLKNGKFIAYANDNINPNTIIEICPTISMTKKDAIMLSKAVPSILPIIIIDNKIISEEAKSFSYINELNLEDRLNSGEIDESTFIKLLFSNVDTDSILSSKSHVLLLGNSLLYEISETPNLVFEYNSMDKVGIFKSISFIQKGTQLTYYK